MPAKLTDYLRIALYGLLIAVLMLLFQAWDKDHPKLVTSSSQIETSATGNNYIPQVANQKSSATSAAASSPVQSTVVSREDELIHVITDVVDATIDARGGNIVGIKLLNYPEKLNSKTPFLLLNNQDKTRYLAQSGLLSENGPDTARGQALYSFERANYSLSDNQQELTVNLSWKNNDGIKVTKSFIFHRGNYEIDMKYAIDNQSNREWNGNIYTQLLRTNSPPENSSGFLNLATYFGAAVSSPEKPFEKISFKEMAKANINQPITGGWAAMVQHYFVSAWVPDKNATSQYYSRVSPDGMYTIGMVGPKQTATPGAHIETNTKFYAGPSIAKQLKEVAPGLDLTIDYGWLWFISVIIFWMMQKIYYVVGNWGWSIVLVTLVIKLMFYHLSAKSYRSMSGLKKLQPRINQLKERFGEDKQKFTQAVMEIYKKEKINPMGGCLPILIQIPVFIALYWVLIESVELRQAPFILWIQDLSIKDPFYVLPILMGISMYLQQRLNPPPPDPMQAKIFMLLPIVFTVMFLNFPAGLMLYWFVNNTLSFLQQWFIMHRMEKSGG